MIALVAVLAAFALGYLMSSRLAANVAYAVAYLWAFVFQTLYLLLDSLGPAPEAAAFERGEFPLSYGLVTLVVLLAGFGLVEAGRRLRGWRAARAVVAQEA